MDDFAVFLRGAGFVFLLFVLFFVFLFVDEDETFLASFEEEDVPDGEDEDCARIREEIGKSLIFFFPFFKLFALLLAHALKDEEYDEQHIIVVIETVTTESSISLSLSLSLCLF